MKWMLDIDINAPVNKIAYTDKIFVIGSCFTEHIGGRLADLKFSTLQNPNGILFDPTSVCGSLLSYINNKQYSQHDLFYLNELWQSWQHHSIFTGTNAEVVLTNINQSQQRAHHFLKEASWLIITLGSSFSYRLATNGETVANCHRAPAQTFNKHLISIEEITSCMFDVVHQLSSFNPSLNIILTISPVRHIRDGVIENNRSKARLIEAVHQVSEQLDHVHYFPAYELVIDVLRDHRYYDIDLVHPNYAATEYVFEKFTESYFKPETKVLVEEVKNIVTAFKHKAFQPSTSAHKKFLKTYYDKVVELQIKNPQINFESELAYFNSTL